MGPGPHTHGQAPDGRDSQDHRLSLQPAAQPPFGWGFYYPVVVRFLFLPCSCKIDGVALRWASGGELRLGGRGAGVALRGCLFASPRRSRRSSCDKRQETGSCSSCSQARARLPWRLRR